MNTTRREFLAALAALSAGVLRAGDPPKVTGPRATSGDRLEPDWEERLTLTVGPKDADLVGTTQRVIQAAVDHVARLGGGTVKLLPGTYRLRNAVTLSNHVRLLGCGADTILVKEASHASKLAADSDWFDQEITLVDGKGFQLGDGICLRARNPDNTATTILKRTLVARSGSRFKLDRPLRENLWEKGNAEALSLFPLVTAENCADLRIENLVLDGNRANNANLDGNYAGCIFLQDVSRVTIRGVEARNYNGDGISWQIGHDVLVEDCHSHDHAGLGLHPGSGSQRPIIRRNRLERNNIGLFFCWGVKFGLAEENTITESGTVGISIGHRDTDNLIRANTVRSSGKVGVLFRPERGRAFAPHRNRLEANRIFDSGPADGVGIDVQGQVEQLTIADNEIAESREPGQRIGIRIGPEARRIALKENRITGVATEIVDRRPGE
jgi:hypothetical protein